MFGPFLRFGCNDQHYRGHKRTIRDRCLHLSRAYASNRLAGLEGVSVAPSEDPWTIFRRDSTPGVHEGPPFCTSSPTLLVTCLIPAI